MSDTEEFQSGGATGDGGEGGFLQFLNRTGSSSNYTVVDPTNPVEWANLAKAFFASLVGGIAIGIQYGINGLVDGVTGIFDGLTEFVYTPPAWHGLGDLEPARGLVPTVRRGFVGLWNAAVEAPEGLGWLTWPVYIAELLVAMYIVVWTLRFVREEVL